MAVPTLDVPGATPYPCIMVIDSIRELNRAQPFAPYEIQMASGKSYLVPHPDFILVSPRGHYVIVVDRKERPHHLSALLIERASPLSNSRKRTSKKRKA